MIPGQPVTLGLELLDELGSNVSYKSILNVWTANSTTMNFFVFFAQVIPHTFSVNLAESSEFFTVLQRLYNTLYSFWRLEIAIPHEWCFTHPVPSPEIFLIIYGQALYTLLLLLIFLLFVKLHDRSRSPAVLLLREMAVRKVASFSKAVGGSYNVASFMHWPRSWSCRLQR